MNLYLCVLSLTQSDALLSDHSCATNSWNRKEPSKNTNGVFLVKATNQIFSRVLRDSTPRYVGPLVGRLVGPLFTFSAFKLFGLTAPS